MRFIFGAAEAGFYPGIIVYLTYWFTADERARWVGVFGVGNPLALVIGGPISGFVLDTLNGSMGLGGMAVAVHYRGRAVCSRWVMGFEASHG